MTLNMLFVCQANVCRSPMMAYEFQAALEREGVARRWGVSSRGTSVVGRVSICDVCAEVLEENRERDESAHAHVSRALDAKTLENSDLIIVASRAERGRVSQMAPSVRGRAFTLREAIQLGSVENLATENERQLIARLHEEGAGLRDYAALLHGRRGLQPVPSRAVRRFFTLGGSRSANPLDIPDSHHGRLRTHRAMLRDVQSDVHLFSSQVSSFLAAYAPPARVRPAARPVGVVSAA